MLHQQQLLPGEVLGGDTALLAVGAAVAAPGTMCPHLFGFYKLWLIPLWDVPDEVDSLWHRIVYVQGLDYVVKLGYLKWLGFDTRADPIEELPVTELEVEKTRPSFCGGRCNCRP